jgi:hypothetical protein
MNNRRKGLPRDDHLLYDAAMMADRASGKAIAPFPMNRMQASLVFGI